MREGQGWEAGACSDGLIVSEVAGMGWCGVVRGWGPRIKLRVGGAVQLVMGLVVTPANTIMLLRPARICPGGYKIPPPRPAPPPSQAHCRS